MGKLMGKLWSPSAGTAAAALLAVGVNSGIGTAATLGEGAAAAGQPVHQQFLASGASIVTTENSRACVVSRRIGIETSVYQGRDGTPMPFAQVTRSIAASVQAVQTVLAGQAGPETGFRIQLKYSPAPGIPILLALPDREIDLQSMLEPSKDSLWINGAAATALAAAFADVEAGVPVQLTARSADTGRQVTDVLAAPDLAALAACATELTAAPADAAAAPVTNEIRVSFTATPAGTPLATLPELTACGMTDVPGDLHLARLKSVSGFFAQTDKVFVSFDDAGAVAQMYIPGILDGDFRGDANAVRLSLAADSNLPTAPNMVRGCLGAKTVPVCHYTLAGGAQLLASCVGLPGSGDGPGYNPGETVAMLFPPGSSLTGTPGSGTPRSGTPGSGGGPIPPGFTPGPDSGGPGGGGGLIPPDGDPDPDPGPNPDPGPDPDPSPIPLPAAGWLLLAALMGLARLRFRSA